MELRGNCVTLMSMWVGLLVGVVFGVRSSERKRRQGREACENGLKVVRKEVIVPIGIGMVGGRLPRGAWIDDGGCLLY